MKMSELFMPTLREVPAEAVALSHRLMLRAGLIRKLSNGLFAYLPLGLRAFRKVEAIIREEMDAIGAMEFKPPVIQPAELWKESGRWQAMGDALLKAESRTGAELIVSPTAEEAFTFLLRQEVTSYRQLPLSVYQINTKFRDEVRPRYGVMRGREFTMKDAYSFHADEMSLDETYRRFGQAYRRVFKRCDLPVIAVKADSGAMGGSGSEEFMVESDIGDNNLILCPKCGYAANDEKARCAPDPLPAQEEQPSSIEEIATPDVRTIDDLCSFLQTRPQAFIKTLIYRAVNCELDLEAAPGCQGLKREKGAAGGYYPEAFFAVCIRGDLDVSEAKLAAALKAGEVELASAFDVERLTAAPVGFAGPVNFAAAPVIADFSVISEEGLSLMHNAVTGALKADAHFAHVEPLRDFAPWMTADLRTVKAGDRCPECGAAFYSKKGNELGHIFKLGTKYSVPLGMTYLDEAGERRHPLMGCYGIGVDRTLASIIEAHNDDDGIVWPMSAAPFQAAIVPVKNEGRLKEVAAAVHAALVARGIEAILDDRDERPGVKFKDIDLIGIPVRVVVGEKHLPSVEIKMRSEKALELVPAESAALCIEEIVKKALAALSPN